MKTLKISGVGEFLFFAGQFEFFYMKFGKNDKVPQPPLFVGEPGRLSLNSFDESDFFDGVCEDILEWKSFRKRYVNLPRVASDNGAYFQ